MKNAVIIDANRAHSDLRLSPEHLISNVAWLKLDQSVKVKYLDHVANLPERKIGKRLKEVGLFKSLKAEEIGTLLKNPLSVIGGVPCHFWESILWILQGTQKHFSGFQHPISFVPVQQ